MKKCLRIAALLLAMCLLAGCGASAATKSYTCRDVTMEIPGSMRDVSNNSDYANFTFALDSRKVAIFGLNETFSEYPVLEEYDTLGYAELVISSYSLASTAQERTGKGYHYVVYTADTDMGEFTYVAGIFRNDAGFWMIQICGPSAQYNEATYLGYLDTVKLS